MSTTTPVQIESGSGESVYGTICALLRQENITFASYEHKPVRTSAEAAAVRKSPLHAGAKAMVFFGDKKPLMIVLAADRKVDTTRFKHLYSIRDLRMASAAEVEHVTRVQIGAVPPFGGLFGLPVYVDMSLSENEQIYFNAGLHTRSISLNVRDYERVVQPVFGSFSK